MPCARWTDRAAAINESIELHAKTYTGLQSQAAGSRHARQHDSGFGGTGSRVSAPSVTDSESQPRQTDDVLRQLPCARASHGAVSRQALTRSACRDSPVAIGQLALGQSHLTECQWPSASATVTGSVPDCHPARPRPAVAAELVAQLLNVHSDSTLLQLNWHRPDSAGLMKEHDDARLGVARWRAAVSTLSRSCKLGECRC
jgi:hypothetical protein